MKCRYVYYPMTAKRIGRRMTLMDRIRRNRAIRRQCKPDMYPVTGFGSPVYPGK